jgi:hypothetical protein
MMRRRLWRRRRRRQRLRNVHHDKNMRENRIVTGAPRGDGEDGWGGTGQ